MASEAMENQGQCMYPGAKQELKGASFTEIEQILC